MRFLLGLIINFVFSFHSLAMADAIILSGEYEKFDALGQSSIFISEDDGFRDLAEIESRLRPVRPSDHNVVSKTSIWVGFALENRTKTKNWFLSFYAYDLKSIEIYQKTNERYEKIHSGGYGLDIRKRSTTSRGNVFALDLPEGKERKFLIKIDHPNDSRLGFGLVSRQMFNETIFYKNTFMGFYFGVLFALIIYHLAMFWAFRDKAYLFYCMFISSMISLLLVWNGYVDEWFNSSETFFVDRIEFFKQFCNFSALLFAASFLGTRQNMPRVHKVIVGLTWLNFMWLLYALFPSEGVYLYGNYNSLLTLSIVVAASATRAFQGQQSALVYLAGWGAFAVSLVVWFASQVGVIAISDGVLNAPLFGNVFEVLTMSVALSMRIRKLEFQKRKAAQTERENIKLQRTIRVLCHDIGNPLAAIAGRLMLMLKDTAKETKEYQRLLDMERSANSIKEVIDSVRKMQAMKDGVYTIDYKSVSLMEAFSAIEAVFEQRCREKEIELVFTGGEDLFVRADPVVLKNDILSNLVSNAIKFSYPKNKVFISANAKGQNVCIEVTDSGVGMSPGLIEKIFIEGERTSRLGTSGEKGTGFGMPLVKSFVEEMGGEISIESAEKRDGIRDSGTTIRLSLVGAEESRTTPDDLVA